MKSPTKSQARVLSRICREGGIALTYSERDGATYHTLSGRLVRGDLVERYVAADWLIPAGDTLFGRSQTYRVAEGVGL